MDAITQAVYDHVWFYNWREFGFAWFRGDWEVMELHLEDLRAWDSFAPSEKFLTTAEDLMTEAYYQWAK